MAWLVNSIVFQNAPMLENAWQNCALNVTGCGWNALNCIFEYLGAHGICVDIILEHANISKCDDFEFMVNKTDYGKNITELMSSI
jgi:hypothetical protein